MVLGGGRIIPTIRVGCSHVRNLYFNRPIENLYLSNARRNTLHPSTPSACISTKEKGGKGKREKSRIHNGLLVHGSTLPTETISLNRARHCLQFKYELRSSGKYRGCTGRSSVSLTCLRLTDQIMRGCCTIITSR